MQNKVESLTKQLTIKDREEQKMLEQTKKVKKLLKGDIPSVLKQNEIVFKNILTNKKLSHTLKYFTPVFVFVGD